MDTTEKRLRFQAQYKANWHAWPGESDQAVARIWYAWLDPLPPDVLETAIGVVARDWGNRPGKPGIAPFKDAVLRGGHSADGREYDLGRRGPGCRICCDGWMSAPCTVQGEGKAKRYVLAPEQPTCTLAVPCKCSEGQIRYRHNPNACTPSMRDQVFAYLAGRGSDDPGPDMGWSEYRDHHLPRDFADRDETVDLIEYLLMGTDERRKTYRPGRNLSDFEAVGQIMFPGLPLRLTPYGVPVEEAIRREREALAAPESDADSRDGNLPPLRSPIAAEAPLRPSNDESSISDEYPGYETEEDGRDVPF